MLQNYNKWQVLRVFFDRPFAEGGFQLREMSRLVKLAPTSVKNYLQELKEEGLIAERKNRVGYPTYCAQRDNPHFKFYKKIDLLARLQSSGLLSYLQEKALPQVIILFGSAARGEDTEHSDIDLFVQAKPEKVDVEKYEKKLSRRIQVFFEPDLKTLSKELKNNIINGIILSGYVKVF
ncbi:nucleotidyltransferase domain-containing protein [Candidatus Woesearchaeota archaeon]|nr:nucleotidyltransferase domain-containing protein [Candidatus Woesearchaeota archaeon]